MHWLQIYNPLDNIGISALVAAIPLFVLFYMLAVRRSPGHFAALFATGSAVILAILPWKMPPILALNATLMGAAFGIFPIVWIILTAIWLYNMTVESGQSVSIPLLLWPPTLPAGSRVE
jgi:lactate permease